MLTEKEKLILILDLDLDMLVGDFEHFKSNVDILNNNIDSLNEEEINALHNFVINHEITEENSKLRNYLIENLNIFKNKKYLKFLGELHIFINNPNKDSEKIKQWLDNNINNLEEFKNE